MPTIRINSIDSYYEIHGQGSPLILIAGLASDSQSWLPVLKGLAQHFKVVILDNRGIGRTQCPKDSFSISTLALDTVCLLDELKIDRADILGHSMGGCIAQEIAIRYPHRVNKLILVNTSASFSQRDKNLLGGLLKILEENKDYELFIREFFNLIFTPEYLHNQKRVEAAIKYAVEYPYPITYNGFKMQLEALSRFNSCERLKEIKAQTLIMAATQDALIIADETQTLADKILFAKILHLENAAHAFQVEQPDFFVSCVLEFLAGEK